MLFAVEIIIIIIIIIINFVYVSGYLAYTRAHNLAYRLIGDTTRTNRNEMLKMLKYSGVTYRRIQALKIKSGINSNSDS